MEDSNQINKLSLGELLKDAATSLTDIEKRFVKTFIGLMKNPHTVIRDYVSGGQKNYVSVFRYFLFSVFMAYVLYELFFQPQNMKGPFYTYLLEQSELGAKSKSTADRIIHVNKEHFDHFFQRMSSMMTYSFKLVTCVSVPSIFVGLLAVGRKSDFNKISLFVASIFLGSQISFISSMYLSVASLITSNHISPASNAFSYVFIFFYLWFAYYLMCRSSLKWPKSSAFFGAFLSVALLLVLYVGYGSALSMYIYIDSPSYYFNEYPDPLSLDADLNPR